MEDAARGPAPAADPFDTGVALGQIARAVHAAHALPGSSGAPGVSGAAAAATALSANQALAALTLLRELRTQIAGWEPELIEAARALGTSWADLAPALGVASRQAAERRYLRLRPAPDGTAGTGEQKVAAERDKRAGDKAVAVWARANAGDLRQLAGQIGALNDLPEGSGADLAALHQALGRDDAADLLGPLADAAAHVQADHPGLAAKIDDVARSTAQVRLDSDRRRTQLG